jgi:hypothetical protein
MRRAKPRWGWEITLDSDDLAKREATIDYDWLVVEIGGKYPTDPIDIERTISASLLSFYGNEFTDPGPTWEQVSATLEEVSCVARDLAMKIAHLDQRSRAALGLAYNRLAESDNNRLPENEIDESANLFLQHLSGRTEARIVDAAKVLAEAVDGVELPAEQKSRGPRPKQTVKRLIESIASMIEEHSDRGPLDGFHFNATDERYEGSLVEILEHILANFAPELGMTNSAIGGQIRRTIGDLSR